VLSPFHVRSGADLFGARLYVVGAGDLGTSAFEINDALERVFDIATSWKAIVLIDEVGF
jgi:hypothetical protein